MTPTSSKKMTLLSAIESVYEKSKGSQLSEEFYSTAETELKYLARRMKITKQQAAVAAVMFGNYGNRRLSMTEFSRHIDCSPLHGLTYSKDVNLLIHNGWLHGKDTFTIPNDVMTCLVNNEVYHRVPTKGLGADGFYGALADLCDDLDCGTLEYMEFESEIIDLIEDNQELNIFSVITKYNLDLRTGIIVYWCANQMRSHPEDPQVSIDDIIKIYDNRSMRNIMRRALKMGRHELLECGIMEFSCVKGFKDTNALVFCAEARDILELECVQDNGRLLKHLTQPDTIQERELFYNEDEEKQIRRLADVLQPENFGVIQAGLDMSNLRTGFNICLYGQPGAGKTETVLQLAKSSGRAIWKLDLSKMKSKWVGDSESITGWVFDQYKKMCKQISPKPILFINEADGLFNKRIDLPSDSVDQMCNTVQNILLDGLEKQQGIVIITTNLEGNLDPAFERRFLLKIKLDKPNQTTRAKLWSSMLPDLTAEQAEELASRYEFSGGQIENVARKSIVNKILDKNCDYFSEIISACDTEKFQKKSCEKIGF